MATWRADVFVNSQVGKITTEVEAATFGGAKQQIYARHGNVQSITNLHQVRKSSGSSSSSDDSLSGTVALVGLIAAAWVFVTFAPYVLMGIGGTVGAWIGEKVTGQSLDDYSECDEDDNASHVKFLIMLVLSLTLGGVGFVKGIDVKNYFETPTENPPAQVKAKP